MFVLYIFLGIYAFSIIIGLAYPTFMKGVFESKGELYFTKASRIEEIQTLFFFWPAYILLGIVAIPIICVVWCLYRSILFLGHQWGKRQ